MVDRDGDSDPTAPAAPDAGPSPAEELPGLYRAILERVAELEQVGRRPEATRIRHRRPGPTRTPGTRPDAGACSRCSPEPTGPSPARSSPAPAAGPGSCGEDRRPRASLPAWSRTPETRPVRHPGSVDAATDLAVEGLLALGELGEDVDDEWQYVQDLVEAWRDRLEEVGSARAGEPLDPARGAAVARVVDEAQLITDPHRAIDWLSTLPQVALVALGRAAVRFQDAAPDARAVVYAGVQADPLVARAADLLAGASLEQRVLARAAMNGEIDRRRAWRTMFPSLFGRGCRAADPRRLEAILEASLAVADRGEQVRSQFRGAIVESLTERLLRRPAGARLPRSGASDGSCSTAFARRSTRTTSRSRSTAPAGDRLQVGRPRDLGRRPPPARRRAAACR